MSRSIWKGPFSLLKKESKSSSSLQNKKQDKTILVWSRNSMILPEDIGKDIQIYNGKGWALRKVLEDMVGHKCGEFSSTKKKTINKVNKTRQIRKK